MALCREHVDAAHPFARPPEDYGLTALSQRGLYVIQNLAISILCLTPRECERL